MAALQAIVAELRSIQHENCIIHRSLNKDSDKTIAYVGAEKRDDKKVLSKKTRVNMIVRIILVGDTF